MKKVTVLIPMNYNNGSPVPKQIFTQFEKQLLRIAGGYSMDGIVEGGWRADETDYFDKSKRYIILTDQVEVIKSLTIEIGKQLEQQAMYFEVQETNIEFIEIG
jgi:hypothetical protein